MHRETVFIIDDDGSVRDALMLLLSLRGHACAAFASAEDFLAALQPSWRGCVVADIRMSGMSGLQLQAMLREQGYRTWWWGKWHLGDAADTTPDGLDVHGFSGGTYPSPNGGPPDPAAGGVSAT